MKISRYVQRSFNGYLKQQYDKMTEKILPWHDKTQLVVKKLSNASKS